MIKPIMRATPLIFVAMLTVMSASPVSADAYYRWKGADGVVHYGSRPPEGVEAELVNTWGKPAGENVPTNSGTTGKSGDASLDEKQKELVAQREQECKDENARLKALQSSGSRIRMTMEDGSTRYLSPQEVAEEIKRSREFIDGACS